MEEVVEAGLEAVVALVVVLRGCLVIMHFQKSLKLMGLWWIQKPGSLLIQSRR